MAITVFPNASNLDPATINHAYHQAIPFQAVGGVAPYTWSYTGNLPSGMIFTPANQLLGGVPIIGDQYESNQLNFTPGAFVPNTYQAIILNPSTFTIIATDSTLATGSTQYTLPVGIFTEDQAISIFEMLRAAYNLDWYVVMNDLGTRNVRIGDIGSAGQGSLRLQINAMLSMFTTGMVNRMKYYITEFDKVKLLVQTQVNGSVAGITGNNMIWENKKKSILELFKTLLPAYTRNEILARQQHNGGSDSVSRISGNSVGTGFVQLSR